LPTRGGPNPDYLMYNAAIDAARSYRLEGQLNDSERVGVGLYAPITGGGIQEMGHAVFDASGTDADGRFALDMAVDARGPGTLPIPPGARILLVRVTHRDPAGEPARLQLTGGAPDGGLIPATGTAEGAIERAAGSLLTGVREYLRWTAAVASRPNALLRPPLELATAVNAEPATQYFLGYFDLAEDQWLEVTMPPAIPGYWSLHAYNHWFEHLRTVGLHDRNAVAEEDGRVRARIGPAVPPHLPNRIETKGRRRGALIGRVMDGGTITGFVTRIATSS
jgi:hypothetical protein